MVLALQSDPQASGGEAVWAVLKLFVLIFRAQNHPLALAIIFCLVIAVLCATVAGNRGRSRLGWGLLGLLFSVVALIVLLLLPSKPREPESSPIE